MATVQLLSFTGECVCDWTNLPANTTLADLSWRIEKLVPDFEVAVLHEAKILQPCDLVVFENKEMTILTLLKLKQRFLKIETYITVDGKQALRHKGFDTSIEVSKGHVTVKTWLARLNATLPSSRFNDHLKAMMNEDLAVRQILRRNLAQSKCRNNNTVAIILWRTSSNRIKLKLDTQYFAKIHEPTEELLRQQEDNVL